MEAALSSEPLTSTHSATWCRNCCLKIPAMKPWNLYEIYLFCKNGLLLFPLPDLDVLCHLFYCQELSGSSKHIMRHGIDVIWNVWFVFWQCYKYVLLCDQDPFFLGENKAIQVLYLMGWPSKKFWIRGCLLRGWHNARMRGHLTGGVSDTYGEKKNYLATGCCGNPAKWRNRNGSL